LRVLVTGATGFVGTALVDHLAANPAHQVRCVVRRSSALTPDRVERVEIPEITGDTSWSRALAGTDVVVHLAAKVHDLRASGPESVGAYRAINTDGTLNLARQAASAGVKRFVFLSSVKVNGEEGQFNESDAPRPVDPYGVSKLEAEKGLREVAATSRMSTVVVRPPLVYGRGVKANFRALLRAVARGIPLPLGDIHNKRSLVALDNLVDFLTVCLEHPMAANETFFVSDGDDVSTTELLRRVGAAVGKPVRLIPVPPSLLMLAAALVAKRDAMHRLLGTLTVDISKARESLGWRPVVTMSEGLRRTVAGGIV